MNKLTFLSMENCSAGCFGISLMHFWPICHFPAAVCVSTVSFPFLFKSLLCFCVCTSHFLAIWSSHVCPFHSCHSKGLHLKLLKKQLKIPFFSNEPSFWHLVLQISVSLLCISLLHILEQKYIAKLYLWFGLDEWWDDGTFQTLLKNNY